MKEKLEKIWNYVRIHKYGVTLAVFVLIIGVLDENSWIERLEHRREINRLNSSLKTSDTYVLIKYGEAEAKVSITVTQN